MSFMGKELKDIIVTLPLADGTEMECGVVANFDVAGKTYVALLPFTADQKLDFSQGYMLYRVEEDEEKNPMVLYIEDDKEYAAAANFFSETYLKR